MGRVVGLVGSVVGVAAVVSSVAGVGATAQGVPPAAPQVVAASGITVPDVRCSALAEAQAALVAAGLVGQPLAGDYGVVLSQKPAPGEEVEAGTTVYVVMQPPGSPRVTVPDVRGRNLRTAKRLLAMTCLDVTVDHRVPHGRIALQSPNPGTMLRVGTPVGLVMTVGPPPSHGRDSSAHGGPPGADAPPPGSGGGSVDEVTVGLLALLVLAMALAAVLLWRGLVRSRLQGDPIADHQPVPTVAPPLRTGTPPNLVHAGSELPVPAGMSPPPNLTQAGPALLAAGPQFAWLAKRGTTSTTIDEDES